MRIQVFATGCAPCKVMLRNVEAAVAELGLTSQVEHVTRLQEMLDAGITGTPALVVNARLHGVMCSPVVVKLSCRANKERESP